MDKSITRHPGYILRHNWLKPLKISQKVLAQRLHCEEKRINLICVGQRTVTVDTAIRLGRFFGNDPTYWLGLQAKYDISFEKVNTEEIKPWEVR